MTDPKITVRIDSSRPIFVEADASAFGQIFAGMNDHEQVDVLRSMVEHMSPHKMQWDYIAMALEKDENREVRDDLSVIFPATNTMLERIAALEAENADLRSGSYLASVVEERDRLRKALEWALDNATDSDHPHYPCRGESWPWEYPYLVSGTPLGGGVGAAGFSTALEAVEAARAALEAKPKPSNQILALLDDREELELKYGLREVDLP